MIGDMIGDQTIAAEPVSGDDSFDRYARMVRRLVGVPVALVSIVESDRQVFPGADGLPQPWQDQRQTPLSHSFCQYVVADRAPLIIEDARNDARLKDNLAIEDLNVIAYVGFPLTDARGIVIGSLCAIDSEPRLWTPPELVEMADLAASCSAELALRQERQRADASEGQARTLLALSEALAHTVTLSDVATAVDQAAVERLGSKHARVWLDNDGQLTQVSTAAFPQHPLAADDGDHDARATMPLTLAGQQVGVLALQWSGERTFTDTDRVLIAALTSYTAQAVTRARLLAERVDAAATLQAAMLTTLPTHPALGFAARYRPAAAHDQVGGDWYDALVLPDGRVRIAVGDVVGHDITAAATMGQLRSMLRALIWTQDEPPAQTIGRLGNAMRDLRVGTVATLLLASISGTPGGQWEVTFSNAGGTPPILVTPDGKAISLDDGHYDVLLGLELVRPRQNKQIAVPSGSHLFIYTDGLIESRDHDLAEGTDRLLGSLARRFALPHADLGALVDSVLDDLVGHDREDDVVALLVHLP